MSDEDDSNQKVLDLREKLLQHQEFFKKLYFSSKLKTRQHLNVASTKQLKLLIKVLHHIFAGDIPLQGEFFQKIKDAKKLSFCVRTFEHEKDVEALLGKDRKDLLAVLYKIQSVLTFLMSSLK